MTARVAGAGVGVRAAATASVDEAGRVRWEQAWPVLLRPTGPGRVHLVHGSGGPLGGDDLSLDVHAGAGASLTVHSAAATIVQPGERAGVSARWGLRVSVGAGGCVAWLPEPTVVCDGAALDSVLGVDVAAGGRAVVREVVVLGRHGQLGGRYAGTLVARVGGTTVLAHTTVLDGADPGLRGPGGTGGARAVGSLLVAGTGRQPPAERTGERPGVRWAWSQLDGPGALLLAVGDPALVIAVLAAIEDSATLG